MAISSPPLATRKKVVVIAGVNLARCYDAELLPLDIFAEERTPGGSYMGTVNRAEFFRAGVLRCRFEVHNSGELGACLAGCGYITAGTDPTSAIGEMTQVTCQLYEDGRKKEITKAMGNIRLECAAGGRLFANAEFTGLWQAVVDSPMPELTPPTTIGYRAADMTFSGLPLMGNITVDCGANVVPREDVTDVTGNQGYLVVDRNPTITVDPEANTVADSDQYGLFLAGTLLSIAMTFKDPAGNTMSVTADQAQRIGMETGDRDGKMIDSITFECQTAAGDDDLVFAH